MNVLRSLVSTPAPNVAIEIASDRVTAVSLGRGGPGAVVTAHATEALAPGAVVPAVNEKNVQEPAVATATLERALERLGHRPRRAALVVPDEVAKVSIIRFDEVPARAHDLDELVRWQVRKTAPFRIEDAQVVYTAGIVDPGGGADFVVALTRRSIVEEYEQICQEAGVYAGIVDLSSFNLVNTIVAGSSVSGDWLLVHIAPESSTIVIVRGVHLILFRNRPTAGIGQLADLVHQTAMYYEDRLGGTGFERVYLVGAAGGTGDAVRHDLKERLGATVDEVDLRHVAGLADRIVASSELLDRLAAPIGVLMRERAS